MLELFQTLKTNPQYIYVELARVNVDDIPRDVKRSFHSLPSEGYVCECRVQVSRTGITNYFHSAKTIEL